MNAKKGYINIAKKKCINIVKKKYNAKRQKVISNAINIIDLFDKLFPKSALFKLLLT